MKLRARIVTTVFLGVASANCVAKIAYQPTAVPPRMSRAQALQQVKALLPKAEPISGTHAFSEFSAYDDRIEFMYQKVTTGGRPTGMPILFAVSYQSIDPKVESNMGWIWIQLAATYTFGAANLKFGSMEDARAFADALFLLKSHPANFVPPVDPSAEADFVEQARRYRALAIKPELPEEARQFKVQAEFAIEQKNFDDAVDLYEEGLRGTPLWPEGHFNRAMILNELVAAAGSFGKEGKAFWEALLVAVQEKRAELAESAPETIASIVQSNMVDEFQAVASVLMNRTPSGGVFVSVLYSFSADVTKGEQVGGQSTFSIGPTGTVFGAEASPSVKRCFGRDGLGR